MVLAISCGCSPADGSLPVVARGRYVEIATLRDEPICGGTARYFDRFIESGMALLGEVPPDRRFVRFEWLMPPAEQLSVTGVGRTRRVPGGSLITSDDSLVHEHELAHAIHLEALPNTNGFLQEGFAILLDSKRIYRDMVWPEGESIDRVISEVPFSYDDYPLAWFLVSQIVRDHGFDGLARFWRAVEPRATAAEVRAAYQAMFGPPIDALVEPIEFEDPVYGHYDEVRHPCNFSLCLAEPETLVDGAWEASGPTDCEDDPDAVGPDRRWYLPEFGDVWRQQVLSTGDAAYFDISASANVAMELTPCSLDCGYVGNGSSEFGFDAEAFWLGADRSFRVEVRASLEDLPTQDPGTLHVEAVSPY
ncbi:MAG: hypothetical protein IPK74_23905 [Deltaproteobacteria bacterium]|nr:hypothetical protein [Deltaproteobacteria bacterium]